jgi:hypothetical protein
MTVNAVSDESGISRPEFSLQNARGSAGNVACITSNNE